jgi:hypothetical protein
LLLRWELLHNFVESLRKSKMQGPEVSRSPFNIKFNTLPESHLGHWFSNDFILQLRVKPAYDSTLIMLQVCPLFLIRDAKTKQEFYRFQTDTSFSFSGTHSKKFIHDLMYHLVCVSIDEFNDALQETKSLLAVHKTFVKPTREEFEPQIIEAFKVNHYDRAGITPYWKKKINKTQDENEIIIKGLPPIPSSKIFKENQTFEQEVLTLSFNSNHPDEEQVKILKENIAFYKKCFEEMKTIDLNILTETQCNTLRTYLNQVFSAFPVIFNDVTAELICRVTVIKDDFIEDGKVRKTNYLSYPPLKINQRRGVYNRANSPERTIFYASPFENVAIRETKPEKGKRIIVSKWMNHSAEPITCFPLCVTAGIQNEFTDKATYAFEKICENLHPVLAEWMECFFTFLASEFIKEGEAIHPRRFDYIFSAFFADRILQPFPKGSKLKSYEAIVYPSVAWNHLQENIAVLPEIIDQKFFLIEADEYEIIETWYDKKIQLNEYPCRLRFIRKAQSFTNGYITWSDDV